MSLVPGNAADTLVGDTVQYEIRSAASTVFGSGSAVVDANVEFIVDAAADFSFSDGKIAVDISDSSILFKGPTTGNTFRYGYESIRVFSLDFRSGASIGSINTTINLADQADLNVTFGPHEVTLHLGNSLWVPGSGDTVRVDLRPALQGDLFITRQDSATSGSVLRYQGATGSFLGVFASGGGVADPLGLTFGPNGDLYVCSGNSDEVLRYDGQTGAFIGVFASGGGLRAPINLTFGPDGNLYVSSSFSEVIRYNGATGAFKDVFISDNRLAFPRGLTFGPDGNLYVVSYNNGAVLRYDGTTGAFIDTFVAPQSGGLYTPSSLAFGPDGNLYVPGGSFPATGVFRYNGSTGEFIDQFVVTGDNSPIDVAFGRDGNLYVLIAGNFTGVARFNGLSGAFIDNFVPDGSGGLLNPYAMVFRPAELCAITCPGDITRNNDPGQCGAVVNYPPPTMSGACGDVICTPAPSSLFPVGSTTVTCGDGGSESCAFTVTVSDVEAPSISCPVAVTVTNNPSQPSTVVNFSVVATDNCPGGAPVCSPPSGSTFPMGMSIVHCTATDASGNSLSCDFTVNVAEMGPRDAIQSALNDLRTLRTSSNGKQDRKELDDASKELAEALKPSLWIDQAHLQPKDGEKSFEEARDTVHELRELVKSKKSSIPDATLQDLIDRLARSDRLLAQIAINDAVAAFGKRREIREANKELAEGDHDLAQGQYDRALDDYRQAWEEAIEAAR